MEANISLTLIHLLHLLHEAIAPKIKVAVISCIFILFPLLSFSEIPLKYNLKRHIKIMNHSSILISNYYYKQINK